MILVKPEKRGPRPKRPIPRTSTKTKRSKGILPKKERCKNCGGSFKSHDPESILPNVYGCYNYHAAKGKRQKKRSPTSVLREKCNKLWSLIVRSRDGDCECPRAEHNGVFQGCHGFGKKAYPAVRHLLINGWKMTSGCHRFYTSHSIEWDQVMRDDLGELAYQELRSEALRNQAPPLEDTYAKLAAEAKNRGIPF